MTDENRKTVTRGFRLTAELNNRIESLRRRMAGSNFDLPISAVVRAALGEGLTAMEARYPAVPAKALRKTGARSER